MHIYICVRLLEACCLNQGTPALIVAFGQHLPESRASENAGLLEAPGNDLWCGLHHDNGVDILAMNSTALLSRT